MFPGIITHRKERYVRHHRVSYVAEEPVLFTQQRRFAEPIKMFIESKYEDPSGVRDQKPFDKHHLQFQGDFDDDREYVRTRSFNPFMRMSPENDYGDPKITRAHKPSQVDHFHPVNDHGYGSAVRARTCYPVMRMSSDIDYGFPGYSRAERPFEMNHLQFMSDDDDRRSVRRVRFHDPIMRMSSARHFEETRAARGYDPFKVNHLPSENDFDSREPAHVPARTKAISSGKEAKGGREYDDGKRAGVIDTKRPESAFEDPKRARAKEIDARASSNSNAERDVDRDAEDYIKKNHHRFGQWMSSMSG